MGCKHFEVVHYDEERYYYGCKKNGKFYDKNLEEMMYPKCIGMDCKEVIDYGRKNDRY